MQCLAHITELVQEKNLLLAKVKSLEKETSSKPFRGERDKVYDELRSKLKAAESLCESLMDENEDMKREIRQLEEEIYELQDNFRYYIFLCNKRYRKISYYIYSIPLCNLCYTHVICHKIYM